MLINYGGEFPYRMTELYTKLGLSQTHYSDWVKINLLSNFEKDYEYEEISLAPNESERKRGNFRREYRLTKRTAEEMALLAKTPEGKILRRWLLDLKDAVENLEYLKEEEFMFLLKLMKVFTYVSHQKAAQIAHENRFIEEHGGEATNRIFFEFHKMRNQLLRIEPDQIKERVQRYFEEEGRLIDATTKRDIIAVLDKFDLIAHGAFDYLKAMGKPSERALRVMALVKKVAVEMEPIMKQRNEDDLFDSKVPLDGLIMRTLAARVNRKQLN